MVGSCRARPSPAVMFEPGRLTAQGMIGYGIQRPGHPAGFRVSTSFHRESMGVFGDNLVWLGFL